MADKADRTLKVGDEFPDCSSFLKKVQEIGNAQGIPFTRRRRRDTHKTETYNRKAGKVVYESFEFRYMYDCCKQYGEQNRFKAKPDGRPMQS